MAPKKEKKKKKKKKSNRKRKRAPLSSLRTKIAINRFQISFAQPSHIFQRILPCIQNPTKTLEFKQQSQFKAPEQRKERSRKRINPLIRQSHQNSKQGSKEKYPKQIDQILAETSRSSKDFRIPKAIHDSQPRSYDPFLFTLI